MQSSPVPRRALSARLEQKPGNVSSASTAKTTVTGRVTFCVPCLTGTTADWTARGGGSREPPVVRVHLLLLLVDRDDAGAPASRRRRPRRRLRARVLHRARARRRRPCAGSRSRSRRRRPSAPRRRCRRRAACRCLRSRTVTSGPGRRRPAHADREEPLTPSVRRSLLATPSARREWISDRIAWLASSWASTSVAPVPWVANKIVPRWAAS